MAYNDDVQKLASFLNKLNQIKTKSSTIKEPSCNIRLPVNSCESGKQLRHLQKCLMENENCHSLLNVIEFSMNLLLDKCIKEKQIVNANIEMSLRKKGSFHKIREHHLKRFMGAPYFKDNQGFSSPPNADVSIRNVQGFHNPYKMKIYGVDWSEIEKNAVIKFIRKVEEEKWIETLKLCGMLSYVTNVQQMTLKELLSESRYDEYDWLEISVSCLKNARSPEECQRLWSLCLDPQINQEAWSEEESKKLETLVLQNEGQDWDKIVRELGTKRSAFSCLVHFQQHLCKVRERQWNEKEIDALKYYVKLFSCRGYIPWNVIRKFIDGRSQIESSKKWADMAFEGKPRTFSLEEDIVLVAGMRIFGKNFARIKEYLPDRTVAQVSSRIEVLKYRQFPKRLWSIDDDILLRDLVDKYGFGNWLKISLHFVNRSRACVWSRYNNLLKNQGTKSTAPHGLEVVRHKSDPVSIPLLWESAVKICQENNIPIDNWGDPSVNIVHELSEILQPRMRSSKQISERKLRPFSNREYNNFFRGAYMLNESKEERVLKINMRKLIHVFVHDVVIVLKLLGAKINLPVSEEIKNDAVIPCQDKFVIKYLMKEIQSRNDVCSDIFLPHNSSKPSVVTDENAGIKADNSCYLFPPNFVTLLAMRSLLLDSKNQKEQKEGLTMQLDNIELKHENTFCSPKRINYGKSHVIASNIWIERMNLLLSGVSVMLKEKGKNYTDTF